MAVNKEKLSQEIEKLIEEYKELYTLAVENKNIDATEFENLSYYSAYIMAKRAELTIIIYQEKNPTLSKEDILIAIGKSVYDEILKQYKLILDLFEKIKVQPNFSDIFKWEIMVSDYKINVQGLLALSQLQPNNYHPLSKIGLIAGWGSDLKLKEKDFEKIQGELEKIKGILRLDREAKSETSSDEKAIATADFGKIKELFRNLLDRMQTSMLELNVHFVGWLKASEAVCLSHLAAESKFKALMASQEEELGEVAAYKAIAGSIASTLAGVIFPGITTPFKTIVSTVMSPVVDKKVIEYSTATATISGKVKSIKIGQEVTKAKADTYASTIDAISTDLLKAGKLILGTNDATKISSAPATGAHESLIKKHLEIHTMVHEVATKCLTVLNILQDWDNRLTRMNDDLFNDEQVDTSEVVVELKNLYKKYSATVNTLRKAVKGLVPPSISEAKPDNNDVYKEFINVMLLTWTPGLREYKTRINITRLPSGAAGIKTIYTQQDYYNYVPVIDGAVQDAYKTFCGITINNVPREASVGVTWADMRGTATEADQGIANLISTAAAKLKDMESTDVWSKAMGI